MSRCQSFFKAFRAHLLKEIFFCVPCLRVPMLTFSRESSAFVRTPFRFPYLVSSGMPRSSAPCWVHSFIASSVKVRRHPQQDRVRLRLFSPSLTPMKKDAFPLSTNFQARRKCMISIRWSSIRLFTRSSWYNIRICNAGARGNGYTDIWLKCCGPA